MGMTKGWMFGFGLIVIALAGDSRAAEPSGNADAEIRMLRSTVDRQQREIKELNDKVAELTAQLTELGIAAPAATTQPTTKPDKPKRIVFVLDHYWAFGAKQTLFDEVAKAVNELEANQWFNIVYRPYPRAEPVALQATMLPVTERSKDQVRLMFKRDLNPSPDSLPAMALALKWKPDLVWYVGVGPEDSNHFLAEVRKLNATSHVRINTTVQFLPRGAAPTRFLWELANDSGGVCLDEQGKPLPEPPISMKVELPKPNPPATKPSILRNP